MTDTDTPFAALPSTLAPTVVAPDDAEVRVLLGSAGGTSPHFESADEAIAVPGHWPATTA